MKSVIAQLKDKGSVSRGWIGVQIQPVTSDIADSLGLKKAEGALVAEPQANGPAAKAGIESGDVITAVNGETVKDARELARTIGGLAPGNAVKLNVLHKGQDKVVNLTLGQLPNTLEAKADTDKERQGRRNPRHRRAEARPDALRPPTAWPAPARMASWSPKSIRRVPRPSAASRKATSFSKSPARASPLPATCAKRSMPRAPTTRTAF